MTLLDPVSRIGGYVFICDNKLRYQEFWQNTVSLNRHRLIFSFSPIYHESNNTPDLKQNSLEITILLISLTQ